MRKGIGKEKKKSKKEGRRGLTSISAAPAKMNRSDLKRTRFRMERCLDTPSINEYKVVGRVNTNKMKTSPEFMSKRKEE